MKNVKIIVVTVFSVLFSTQLCHAGNTGKIKLKITPAKAITSVIDQKPVVIKIKAAHSDHLTVSNLPLGATFLNNNDGTGEITWNPRYNQKGSYTIKVSASDTDGARQSIVVSDKAEIIVVGKPSEKRQKSILKNLSTARAKQEITAIPSRSILDNASDSIASDPVVPVVPVTNNLSTDNASPSNQIVQPLIVASNPAVPLIKDVPTIANMQPQITPPIIYNLVDEPVVDKIKADPNGFPKIWLYSRWSSNGTPFIDPDVDDLASKFDLNVIPVEPGLSKYPGTLEKLRTLNPHGLMLGYHPFDFMWKNTYRQDFPDGYIWADVWELVTKPNYPKGIVPDAVLRNYRTSLLQPNNSYDETDKYKTFGETFDFTKPEFVKDYADLVINKIVNNPNFNFDGVYFDCMCDKIGWWDNGKADLDKLNYKLAGNKLEPGEKGYDPTNLNKPRFNTVSEYDEARAKGVNDFIHKIRSAVGPNYILMGNCGYVGHFDVLNGALREYFPTLGTNIAFNGWTSNMMNPRGGFLDNDRQYRTPSLNLININADLSSPVNMASAENQRKIRYGITSALLGGGDGNSAYFGLEYDNERAWEGYKFVNADEYIAGELNMPHYLGQPTGIPYQMVDQAILQQPDLLKDAPWTFYASSSNPQKPNTWYADGKKKDTGSSVLATEINASLQTLMEDWLVIARKPINFKSAYAVYSLTFEAKADQKRAVNIDIVSKAGASRLYQSILLDETSRQYQVSFFIDAAGDYFANFRVGGSPANITIKNVTLQRGVGNVWRRDFEHGSSFINPCAVGADFGACKPVTVHLNKAMQKIKGVMNPALNTGETVTDFALPAADGIILLSTDNPPGSILGKDFHTYQPPTTCEGPNCCDGTSRACLAAPDL